MYFSKSIFGLILVILVLPLILFSCNKQESPSPQDTAPKLLGKNLVKDDAAYQKATNARSLKDDVEFSIEEVKREGKFLKVHVWGGCNEASFKFVWDGAIGESYPMQVSLVLIHEQASEICPAGMDHFIVLDLTELVGENANLDDYIFQISNGSKKQDATLDPNGTTTIK